MKKRFLSLLVAVVACTAAAYAQQSAVATLKHGSNISYYYGLKALASAYEAAAEGDVITLSSGEFDAVNIEKAITVRGAGMRLATENPTILLGDFKITTPAKNAPIVTLEGVQCMNTVQVNGMTDDEEMRPASILKCYFVVRVDAWHCNPTFVHCIFANDLYSVHGNPVRSTYVQCMNCVVRYADGGSLSNTYLAKIDMVNCDVWIDNTWGNSNYSTFLNCVIGIAGNGLRANTQISNSLCYHTDLNYFSAIKEPSNMKVECGIDGIFKTFNGNVDTQETFELKDAVKTKYLGLDGTQVGIYGGANPFNPTPSNAQVKKFAVTTSTTDGQLNVKINVE